MREGLYIFTTSAIWRLTVHDGPYFSLSLVTAEAGTPYGQSVALGREPGGEVAFFFGTDRRVYSFDGFRAEWISQDIETSLQQVIADRNYANPVFGAWDGRWYHLIIRRSVVGTKDWYMYDTLVRKPTRTGAGSVGTWWPQEVGPGGIQTYATLARFAGGTDDGALYGALDTLGKIYQLDSGNADLGSLSISYEAYGGYLDLGMLEREKRVQHIITTAKCPDEVTFHLDRDWGTNVATFTLTEGNDVAATSRFVSGHSDGRFFRWGIEGLDSEAPCELYAIVLRYAPTRPAKGSHG